MLLKYPLVIVLLSISLAGISQKDSVKIKHIYADSNSPYQKYVKKPHDLNQSIKRQFFINAGVGASTILTLIYFDPFGDESYGPPAYGLSQSIVYNGTVDYGIAKYIGLGAGIAYQTATGIPYPAVPPYFLERFSRLNISIRGLFYAISTHHIELYDAIRIGESFWTDVIDMPRFSIYDRELTIGNGPSRFPSFQNAVGLRVFVGHIGINIEAGIGTPYFVEGGIVFRIGKKK